MAEYTKNLNLEKPDYEEYYDIGTFNANADKIDKGIEDSENRSTQRLEVHKDSNDHTADKIRYDGKIPKDNVKDALDETDTRIDNIVSQGGNDNTEVVDARHSTVKDKTYDTLKGRLEDGEQDIEKLKTDTSVAESVTETSYDSVIPVPDSATNGQASGVVGGSTITNLIEDTVVSPLTKELDSTKTYLLIKTDGGTINIDGVDTAVPTKISGKTSTTLTWDAGNIGLYELIDTETSKDVVELAQKYTYINGTKSTISAMKIKSVGKNLINIQSNKHNKPLENRYDVGGENYKNVLRNNDIIVGLQYAGESIDAVSTFKVELKQINKNEYQYKNNSKYRGIGFKFKAEPNKEYTVTWETDEPIYLTSIIWYDENFDRIKFNYNSSQSRITATAPEGARWGVAVPLFDNPDEKYHSIRNLMVEESNTATPYEPYRESNAYVIAKDEEGNILELRSLPNGTKDEISLSEKKAIIKIGTKTDVVSGTVINYTDMADGGQFLAYYEDGTQQVGIKGDTLTATATTLIYQLAEPEIIPVRWTGLQAYEGGTVYVDTVIPELGFYYDNGLESHYPDHPIKEIDTLYRVDKETGYKEPLDVSKCEIREDRLSFTHPDLVDGDLCDRDYVPMTESTRPETSLTFPSNLKASVNSLLDAEQINKKEHNIFKARLDNHDRDIENVQIATDTAQSDIDTHKADKNNPHGVTPEQIGAETPEGAQGKVDVVADDLASHKAESVSQNILATRDLTLASVQSINTQKRPKSIKIIANVWNTKKMSIGNYSANLQYALGHVANTSMYAWTDASTVYILENTNDITRGIIQNVTDTGFEIKWEKVGEGATGNVQLCIICQYHGE